MMARRADAKGGGRRRILVGLDASPASMAALAAALRLAVEIDAELDALYVEDDNMLRFAGLPFTRVIDAYSPGPREVEPVDVERALRLQAERVRRLLAEAAGTRIAWRFRVVRGDVEREVRSGSEARGL